jgi:hypothetical protein
LAEAAKRRFSNSSIENAFTTRMPPRVSERIAFRSAIRSWVMVLRRRSFFPSHTISDSEGGITRSERSARRQEVQKIQNRHTARSRALLMRLLKPAARAPRTSAMSFVSRERSAPVRRV